MAGTEEGKYDKKARGYTPAQIWNELITQLQITWPTALTYASSIVLWFITFVCLGRLGEVKLAGASLGMTLTNLLGNSVSLGLASALDILFTQANGARNKQAMRLVLHRGIMILSISCVISVILLCNGERILLALGLEPELSFYGGTMMKWGAISLWPMTIFDIVKRYFQAMSRLGPPLVVTALAVTANIVSNIVLVFHLDWGVDGVGFSLLLANVILCFSLVLYFIVFEEPNTWWNISAEAFRQWPGFLQLAIPSLVMTLFEWGSLELSLILVGALGTNALATQSITMNFTMLLFVTPASVSTAAINRVGNLLGAGDARGAALATLVSAGTAGITGVLQGSLVFFLRDYWPYIYTNSPELVKSVSEVAPVLALFEWSDEIQATLGAVVRGTGRPAIGALMTGIGFYGICVPLGTFLAYRSGSTVGMWTGFLVGNVLMVISYTVLLVRNDWDQLVEDTRVLLSATRERHPLLVDGDKPHVLCSFSGRRSSSYTYYVKSVSSSELSSSSIP